MALPSKKISNVSVYAHTCYIYVYMYDILYVYNVCIHVHISRIYYAYYAYYIYMYVYIYLFMYIYIYVCIHIKKFSNVSFIFFLYTTSSSSLTFESLDQETCGRAAWPCLFEKFSKV